MQFGHYQPGTSSGSRPFGLSREKWSARANFWVKIGLCTCISVWVRLLPTMAKEPSIKESGELLDDVVSYLTKENTQHVQKVIKKGPFRGRQRSLL